MRAERISTFRNVRARVLVTSEGKWHPGWMYHLGQSEARVRLKSHVEFEAGARILGECYGDGTLVRFTGNVTGQMGTEIAVRIVGSLSFERSAETVRVHVEGVSGRMVCGATTKLVQIVDISPESLGAILPESATVGSIFVLHLDTMVGEISCTVSVLNCNQETGLISGYRVGLRIFDISRLDAARWSRLIEEATQPR